MMLGRCVLIQLVKFLGQYNVNDLSKLTHMAEEVIWSRWL